VRRRERVFVMLLSPALAVLALVTLAPFAFLLLTSLTPLNLARPRHVVGLQPPAR